MLPKMSFTANQCRTARALLGWSQERLAQESRVATRTIAGFEMGEGMPLDRTLSDIRRALETGGVEFTNGKRLRIHPRRDAKFLAEFTAVAESAKSPVELTLKIDGLFSKHVERVLENERRLFLKELAFWLETNTQTIAPQARSALEQVLESARQR
jgi:transcriptional regulator with XRE-family HTH domain